MLGYGLIIGLNTTAAMGIRLSEQTKLGMKTENLFEKV
jgi:hypothetical protein